MRLIAVLVCFILLMGNMLPLVYGIASGIKEEVVELESLIDQEPAFSFRNGMGTKLLLKEELKQAISLSEENKPEEIKIIIHRLLMEIEGRLLITNPLFKKDIRQRLTEILTKITPELAK